jgi:hypothetical protein
MREKVRICAIDPAIGVLATDTARIAHGEFYFSDSLHEPVMAYLYEEGGSQMPDPNSRELFIEPGAIIITLDQGKFNEAKVTGSTTEADYQVLQGIAGAGKGRTKAAPQGL